ncbi:MAG: DUF3341 domain-containing protein [Verrucomicrobiota bacterium]
MSEEVHHFARSLRLAEAIVDQLQLAGFDSKKISVVLSDKTVMKRFAHQHHTKAPDEAATLAGAGGLLVGAIVGAAFGWLASLGTINLPGGGLLVSAGPLVATLLGAAAGSALGGILGAVLGLQFSASGVKPYSDRPFQDGQIMISVYANDPPEAKRARDIFQILEALDKSSASHEFSARNSQDPSKMGWHCAA